MTNEIGTILLIDDDETSHALLRYHLERAGFALISAKDTQAALAVVESDVELTAVLLDIHIPRGDVGWALLARLIRLKQTRLEGTPIIVYSVDDDKVRARAAGADAHFVKPVNYKELISLLESYVQRRSKAKES
jgi:DNA-binding response OmpR family regulator